MTAASSGISSSHSTSTTAGPVTSAGRASGFLGSVCLDLLLTKDNPADLINIALEELVRNSCELPAFSTLDRMAGEIRAQVNQGFQHAACSLMTAEERRCFEMREVAGVDELEEPGRR